MYECNVCKIKIIKKIDLKRHMKDEHASLFIRNIEPSVNTAHKCSVCSLLFIDNISLRQHERLKHSIKITKTLKRTKLKKCVTFEPINLKDYPLLKSLLPKSYVYKVNNMEYLGYNEFRAKFEIADCSEDIFMCWLFELQTKSKVVYRVKSFTKSPNMNVIFNKVYRCVHNTFPSKYAYPHKKHTGCPATLTVRILKCSEALSVENAMANNVVIVPSKAIVTLHHYHNHSLCDASNVYMSPKVIQHNTHLNDHNINNNMNEFNSNTSSDLQVSNENNYSNNSNAEKSEDIIEPENSEIVMNDNIQNLTAENDNNIEFSEEFDNYIMVEYENVTNSLPFSNNDNGNELQQLLSDYDAVNKTLLEKFKSNPKCFKSEMKTYILTMKNSLTSKESLLTALKSFGNLQK